MNGLSRRAFGALAVLAAVILAITTQGCGGGSGGSGASGGAGGSTKSKKEVVVFWQFFPAEQIQPVLDDFAKQNPDLDVQMEQLTWQSGLEKITAATASGNVPDLCELGSTWFPRFASQGALADWSDSTAPLASGMVLADMARVNGKAYGLPWVVGTRALFWNKKLFAQAGIDTTKAPETWDQLIDAARRIDALGGGVSGYGVNAGERYVLFKKFMPFAWGNGGRLLTPDGHGSAFDSRANREALELLLTLAKHGRVDRQDQLDEAFMNGRLGAQISGAWLFRKIPKQAPGLHYGVALVPRPSKDHGTHASFAGGELLTSFAKAKNPSGAWRLAKFLASRPAALKLCKANQSVEPAIVGAVTDAYYQSRPNEAVMIRQLASAVPTPNHPAWLDMEAAIEDQIEQALYGKVTAAGAITAASRRIDQLAKSTEPAAR